MESNTILLETYRLEGIPLLTLAPERAEGCPVVFYVHGYTNDKHEGVELGYRLAEKGFFFVTLDAALHGERYDPRLDQVHTPGPHVVYPFDTGLDAYFFMNEIIVQTAQDVGTLIEHFASDPRIDIRRLGVCGVSMGAFTSFYLAANNPRVQAAAAVIGLPAFAWRWENLLLECSSYEKWATALENLAEESERRTAYMRNIDPFEKLDTFYPKPLCILQGDIDTDAPKIYSLELYKRLKPLYALQHPERLQLRIYDGVAHRFSTTMKTDVSAWFEQYLEAREDLP